MALRTCGDKGNENVYETRKTVQGNKFTLFLPFDSQNVPRRPIQIQYSPSYNCHFDGPKLINTITATVIKVTMYVYGGSYRGGGSYPWEEEGLIHVSQPHGNIPHWKSLHLYSRWLYILPNDRNRSSGHFLMLINYSLSPIPYLPSHSAISFRPPSIPRLQLVNAAGTLFAQRVRRQIFVREWGRRRSRRRNRAYFQCKLKCNLKSIWLSNTYYTIINYWFFREM